MPKSKRSKVVHLSKTEKKGKELKDVLFTQTREAIDSFSYIYLFTVENMRNNLIKDIRNQWKNSKFFFGKNKVMAKALGLDKEQEYRDNLHLLAEQLSGNVGLLFSDKEPSEVEAFFKEYKAQDFARSGCVATETFVLPAGPLFRGEEKVPHNMEVELRNLGLPTCLVNGVVTLSKEHTVCKEGEKLTPEQARLLKHFYIQMADFKLVINGYWHADEYVNVMDIVMK